MATPPTPGSTWQERHPTSGPVGHDDYRRIVRVTSAEDYGFVEGTGVWQHHVNGQWVDDGTPRKTRVRFNLFVERYDRVEEPA